MTPVWDGLDRAVGGLPASAEHHRAGVSVRRPLPHSGRAWEGAGAPGSRDHPRSLDDIRPHLRARHSDVHIIGVIQGDRPGIIVGARLWS